MAKVQFTQRKETNYIVVHCAATRPSMDIGVREIRQWHKALGWLDVGYHYIIRRDGSIEQGRDVAVVGSHVAGHNSDSIGICLAGGVSEKDVKIPENNFTPEQFVSLENILRVTKRLYTKATVKGHRDFNPGKACPSFDVHKWLPEDLK